MTVMTDERIKFTNKIIQHVPGFVEAEPHVSEFTTLDELLSLPWVDRYKQRPGAFHQYSVYQNMLVIEFDNGMWWRPIGYLKKPVGGLPKWKSKP
jgi:hypothetical protein